jgi:tRNA-2-methylthio-N6-dimethylallyladenosine synthase
MKELKTYCIKTYGCAMNYADSDRIRHVLNSVGLKEDESYKKADLIILNSCSVRKQAEDKIGGWYTKIEKENLSDKIFILTGCMATRHNDVKYRVRLKKKHPWIHHIIDIKDISKIPSILCIGESDSVAENYLNIIPASKSKVVINIPISTGCNFFCSYCIVPFSRGDLFHREYTDILDEVKFHIANGVKLITLVAQNVNSWEGMREGKKISFSELLEDIADLSGEFWITFVSSNPMDFSDKMIKTISTNEKIMRWINIAVQSGSDDVLKRMNRRYSVEEFKKLINQIKKEIPDIRLTTDVIVGFPGEKEDDFKKTSNLVKELKFQMAYIGKYSARQGALSAKFEDDVPIDEKKRRENELKKIVNDMRLKFHKEFVVKEIKVLMIGARRGLSYYYNEILLEEPVDEKRIGTFITVSVTKCTLSGLIAKI